MNNRYVFDLDNTLIMTDKLNNDAYNYALSQFGFQVITSVERITRKIIRSRISSISRGQLKQIIDLKQRYFVENLRDTKLNNEICSLLKSLDSKDCILWTSADENRTFALLDFYDLRKDFKAILFSEKKDVKVDIEKICSIFSCYPLQLKFFDDDKAVLERINNALQFLT